eukprot:CAMPEP_0172596638 /NCGR_PEP_ID=MMETSP1068-20121228/16468_1 /TAXON_ID=35684 /ORGANISM="Pseudopedinella elastica, Strain CCMP716" /LENGTH=509 /DNA_ID=CAMNT_0013395781 /DNA_START=186 /DNA_END=1715 /DNA_ORIENTATION=-
MSAYESAVRKLYQVNMWNPVKLGLENIQSLYRLLGYPTRGMPIVHISGTNGKGSVAWKVSRALREAGYRDGLFVSPHVSSFRERVQVSGELISEDQVSAALPRIFDLCEKHEIPATFFELTTALALDHFRRHADVVVLEVGLGGRLDSTNVVTPSVSVITSIGLDHTRILGDTIEEIAGEKAGIMKAGVPVLVGPRAPQQVLRAHAARVGSPYFTPQDVYGQFMQGEQGGAQDSEGLEDFDAENAHLARAALGLLRLEVPGMRDRLTSDHIDRGVASRPPCRYQVLRVDPQTTKRDDLQGGDTSNISPQPAQGQESDPRRVEVVLDVGHNPPALTQLLAKLRRSYGAQGEQGGTGDGRPLRFVLGMSRDKDMGDCMAQILTAPGLKVQHIHLVEAEHPRAASPSSMLARALEMGLPEAAFTAHESGAGGEASSVSRGVQAAVREASAKSASGAGQEGEEEVVVVCGSVFIMADARETLGFDEPKDSDVIVEVAGQHLKNTQELFPSGQK